MFNTVAGRLLGTFALVGLVMACVIAATLWALARASGEMETLATKRLAELVALASMESGASAQAVLLRDLGLNEDVKVQATLLKDLKRAQAETTAALAQLQQSAQAGAFNAKDVEAIAARAAALDAVAKKILAAIDEARFDDLRPLLNDDFRPKQLALATALREFAGQHAAQARASAEHASASLGNLTKGVVVAVVLVFVGAGAMAWRVVRALARTLGGEPAEAAATARELAQGNLAVAFRVREGDTTSLVAALADMQRNLVQVVGRVREGAQTVASASEEIARGNADLSSRTEQQASSLQQTAASMEQLGSAVRHNAANARNADELAKTASTVATRGGEVVNEVVSTMSGINESSRKIAEIIGTIDGIAFQTNILALNAAVEAARAGEQGRGFAVVAGEVRTLAQRSAEAAREIKALIVASIERVEQGSQLVDRAGETMKEVVSSIQRVTSLVNEISLASEQQSSGVTQVGSAVQSMDQGTQQNAALVEEASAAAESLRRQAIDLVAAVAAFRFESEAQVTAS